METINKIRITSHSFKANLEVIIFKEADQMFVGYAPAVDVSSYGDNEKAALEAVKEAIAIYFDYTRNKGTLEKDLMLLGWRKMSVRSSSLVAPDFDQTNQENTLLVSILNSHKNYRRTRISIPA